MTDQGHEAAMRETMERLRPHEEAIQSAYFESAWTDDDGTTTHYPPLSSVRRTVAAYFEARSWPDPAGLELRREPGGKRVVMRRTVLMPTLGGGTHERWVSPWRKERRDG